MLSAYDLEAPKKATNLSINSDLLKKSQGARHQPFRRLGAGTR